VLLSATSLWTYLGASAAAPQTLTLSALPPLLPFPFPPSRLLAPAELCARRFGPLPCHLYTHFG
jgi:hypothetical protein